MIIVSTAVIVILYAVMSTIAAGVLPVEQVANQPLSMAAVSFMPSSVYTFFVVGGAMFALLTTLNFNVGMLLYPLKKASEDGWLPGGLAAVNSRFHTFHWLILVLYLISVLPILFGVDLSTIANSTVILTTSVRGLISFVAMSLPKKMPELWEKSAFHISEGKLKAVCTVSIFLTAISVLMLFMTSSMAQICGNCCIFAAAVILMILFGKNVKVTANFAEK